MPRRGNHEGNLYKREDGRWHGRIRLTLHDGNKVRRDVYAQTRQSVQKEISRLRRQEEESTLSLNKAPNIGEYLWSWYEHSSSTNRVRPKTLEAYRTNINRLVPLIGRIDLRYITSLQVQGALTKLALTLSAYAVRQARSVLHRALRDAVLQRLVPFNVADAVATPRVDNTEIHPLTRDQVRLLIQTDDIYRTCWAVLCVTGVRLGEALALSWDAIDFERLTLSIHRSLQVINGQVIFMDPKTTSSRRTLDLAPELADMLRKHRLLQLEQKMLLGEAWEDSGIVLTSPTGKNLHPATVYHALQRAIKRAGLAHLLPYKVHSLRHSAASLSYEMGMEMVDISALLGHSNVSVTQDIYTHLFPPRKKVRARLMGSLLSPSATSERASEWASGTVKKETAPEFGASSVPDFWQEREGSNPRPPVLETGALPTELRSYMVPLEGLEPPTRDLGRRRSIQLSYRGTLVEIGGLEPPTSALRTPRSPC